MKKNNYFITLWFIFFFPVLCFSQIPGLINYNQRDGLKCAVTYHIRQDKQGFIWIGSDNGLFRFDGVEFKNYNARNGLRNIEVLGVVPLKDKIFIIPFLNDLAYLKSGKVYGTNQDTELKKIKLSSFELNFSYDEKKDELFIFSRNDVTRLYQYKNGKVEIIPLNIRIKDPDTQIIHYDFDSHTVFLGNGRNKITLYNILTRKERILNINEFPFLIKKNTLITKSKNDKVVSLYRLEGGTFKELGKIEIKNANDIHSININDDKLWITLNSGGVLYFNEPFTNSSFSKKPYLLLEDYIINDILVDKDKNVWFSSRDNGLFFISQRFFSNYIDYFPLKNNSANITSIADNSHAIFLGYNISKASMYLPNRKFTEFPLDPSKKTEHRAIYANDRVVIFGQSHEVFQLDLPGFKISSIKPLKNIAFKNVLPYKDDEVLVCSMSDLSIYNYKTKKVTDTLFNERCYTALSYEKDSLLVGTFRDLYKVNVKNKQRKIFLEGYYFTDLKKIKNGLYIGATNLHGVIIFNNHKILRHITEKDGLVTNQIKKIDIENPGTFWASTNIGLMRIKLTNDKPEINVFTQIDGLPSDKVAGCIIKKDTLYAGTSNGLGVFSIKKLLVQNKFINKKVIINSVIIGGKEYFDFNNIAGKTPNSDIIFNLSFPDYTSQGKISYKYKIEGLNDNWYISNSSKIILNSIPPGRYIFKVFGLGYNGKQSYTHATVSFEIKPQFWQTWWFTFLLILLTILSAVILINFLLQRKRNKKLREIVYEKKIAELELQAIKAQINPHFIYNCLNSIQYLLYKKDYQETENYLDVFSQMIRKTLHYSEKTFMSIKEEAEYLTLYLSMEKLRLKDHFEYKITVTDQVNQEWMIPSLLIQPFVENAIKHGIAGLKDRKGNIEILIDYIDSILCITIEDNGAGIENKSELLAKTDSFGVKISQKRIETFKQLFESKIALEINNLAERTGKNGTQIKLYISPYENKNTGLHH